MINNKRGLSSVVTTLIIILLVFIAVGIIWVVIRNVIEAGGDTIDWSSKCLAVSVKSTSLVCGGASANICNVSILREAGGDTISGVKVVFTGIGGNYVLTNATALASLNTRIINNIAVGNGVTNVTGVDIVPYFLDGQNVEHICQ